MAEHADRGRVDDALRAGERGLEVARDADPSRTEAGREPVHAGGGRVLVRVEHVDPRGSLAQQAVADGDTGATGADQQHPVVHRVGKHLAERASVARPVGVAAEHPAVAEQDRVDRAEVAGVVGELVEQGHHRLLERVRDVDPVEAEPAYPAEQLGQVGLRQAVHVGVDQPVGQRQPGLATLALLHRRGERGADPGADQAEGERAVVVHAWLTTLERSATRGASTDLAGGDQVGGRRAGDDGDRRDHAGADREGGDLDPVVGVRRPSASRRWSG